MRFRKLAIYSTAVGAVLALMGGVSELAAVAEMNEDGAALVETKLTPMAPAAVTLYSFQATRLPDGRTDIEWRAGAADDLGFALYREEGGRRKRISPLLTTDAALPRKSSASAGQLYSWWDKAAPRDGAARYWLEVNVKEQRTWHGPLVLVARGSRS